jgi:cytochrome c peroxidase
MKHINLFSILLATVLFGCGGGSQKSSEMQKQTQQYAESMKLEQEIGQRVRSMFQPLPDSAVNPDNALTAQKVNLGKVLYFDVRLSKKQTQDCNTCHNLSTFGVDNKPKSPGDEGKDGDRNSPTVLNAALHIAQFWDGRAKDVEEQAGGPILNPKEMNIPSEAFLVKRLKGIDLYKQLFKAAFPGDKDPITYANLRKAIAAFERTLITPSKFDEYLKGSSGALTLDEKMGLKTFMDVGCITCHTGATLGGNMFQKFGVFANYWDFTKSKDVDEGKAKLSKNEADKFIFKVPSLRNVAMTQPYFHDGSVVKLEDAVKIIAKVNLNRDLTDPEINSIVTFLKTLTGKVPESASEEPKEL